MNLNHLTDKCLLDETKKLASQERQLITIILHHLAEVQKRRLFCNLGCSSLFVYCTEILKYSEAQAHQKISAMRLMLEVPELEKKMEEGDISLTNVAQAQSFFRQEAKETKSVLPIEQKKEVLKKLESTSTRQGQRILLSLSSRPQAVVERERPVTADLTEIRFTANDELLEKLRRLKGLMALKNSNMNYSELINTLCELGLEKLDPVRKAERARKRLETKASERSSKRETDEATKQGATIAPGHKKFVVEDTSATQCTSYRENPSIVTKNSSADGTSSTSNTSIAKTTLIAQSTGASNRGRGCKNFHATRDTFTKTSIGTAPGNRKIPAAVRHQAWLRADGVCENCGSEQALQLDHQIPFALGGGSDSENIRVLCRACNQRSGIEWFGLRKMSQNLTRPGAD